MVVTQNNFDVRVKSTMKFCDVAAVSGEASRNGFLIRVKLEPWRPVWFEPYRTMHALAVQAPDADMLTGLNRQLRHLTSSNAGMYEDAPKIRARSSSRLARRNAGTERTAQPRDLRVDNRGNV